MRSVSRAQRRQQLVRRHHLTGDASTPEQVVNDLLAVHATDPATVYISILARSRGTTIDDIAGALYDRRSLVRWMAMRRTLFVVPTAAAPGIQAAVATPLAEALRRQLINKLGRNDSDPRVPRDQRELEQWLAGVEKHTLDALAALGAATGAQLAQRVPALRTTILPRADSERPQNLTSPLLTVLATSGRMVRGTPTGAWTSRQHAWEPVERWWPDGIPPVDRAEAETVLARGWLQRFGPATLDDLQWWTGWNKGTTARAVHGLDLVDVELDDTIGIALPTTIDEIAALSPQPPAATLLPALDSTPMGWRHRDWFLSIDRHEIFDNAGNIGPTLWWDGEVIGSWAVDRHGAVRVAIVADRGKSAVTNIDEQAHRLQRQLDEALVVPAVRTPLERSLSA